MIWMLLFTLALYLVLTPNLVFRSLPPKGSLLKVALVHGIMFTVIHHITSNHLSRFIYETRESPANKAALKDEQMQRLSLLSQNRQQGI